MRRISTTTKVTDKFGAGKHGFTNGNPIGGVAATDLEDVWFDHIQEELAGFIEWAGLTLDPNNRDQLRAALQAKFVQISAFTGSNQSLAASGFQKMPGGMIRQWGIINSNGSGIGTVTFPIAFPTACVSVQLTDITSGSVATADIWGVGNLTLSGFNGYSKTDTGTAVTTAAYYDALGY